MEQTKRYHTISCSTRRFLIGLTLLAFTLRLPGLFANSFHGDEALFATWARLIAVWRDPLLQTQLVDKPPLLFYLQALFYPLQGAVMWAARLPNWIASILLVPLTAQWVWRWYGNDGRAKTEDRGRSPTFVFRPPSLLATQMILAATLITLSPFAIQFSPTAFLDPLLLFWLVAALTLIDRPGWSGLFFGLALLTKHQAWLFLPLLLAAGWWRWQRLPVTANYLTSPGFNGRVRSERRGSQKTLRPLRPLRFITGRAFARWLAGMLPLLAILLLWEWLRTGSPALWGLQVSNFGGTRLIWSWELWPRLLAWANLLQMGWAGSWLGTLLLLLLGGGMVWLWGQGESLDRLLILFSLAYLALHWLLAIPVWDRYLLLLIPILAVLLARFVTNGLEMRGLKLTYPKWIALFLLLLLLPGAWAGRNGRFPIGGQVGADHGAAVAAAYLQEAPYGTVLYDHWYSWQWRTHLFDKRVHVSWLPHPAHLTQELLVFGGDGHERYLALPTGPESLPMRRAVTEAGFCLESMVQAEGIELYLIVDCE